MVVCFSISLYRFNQLCRSQRTHLIHTLNLIACHDSASANTHRLFFLSHCFTLLNRLNWINNFFFFLFCVYSLHHFLATVPSTIVGSFNYYSYHRIHLLNRELVEKNFSPLYNIFHEGWRYFGYEFFINYLHFRFELDPNTHTHNKKSFCFIC